jgi:hypothetical protein
MGTQRAVLTALLCLALDDRPLHLTEATQVLSGRISDTSRALLGVTGTVTGRRGFLAAYRRVRCCFHAILSTADPSALPKTAACPMTSSPRRPGKWPPSRPEPPATSLRLSSTRCRRQHVGIHR